MLLRSKHFDIDTLDVESFDGGHTTTLETISSGTRARITVNTDELLDAIRPPVQKERKEVLEPDDYERITSIVLNDGNGDIVIVAGTQVGRRIFNCLLKCLPGVREPTSFALHVKTGD